MSTRGLLLRFAGAGLVVLVALAALIAFFARESGTEEAVRSARNTAYVLSRAIVEPHLTPGVVSGRAEDVATFRRELDGFAPAGSLVRVKIWDPDGRIVYSDEPRLLGRSYDLPAAERRILLSHGAPASRVSDLDEAENTYERRFGSLLEVYTGVRSTDGRPFLFEAYFSYDAVTQAGREAWLRFAPPALAALLVLELVQLPFAWALAKRLERQQAERERLLRFAVESSDAERRRIAGDLHDGVIQELTGLTYAMDAMRLGTPPEAQRRQVLSQSASRLRASVAGLRTLMVDLYPPDLEEVGLASALVELADSLEHHHIGVELDIDPVDGISTPTAALVFRAARELIRNAASHSEASCVRVSLARGPDSIRLVVEDDGRGFDAETVELRRSDGHFGLRSLGDLVADAGGRFTAYSRPGAGTSVEVEVPAG